MLLCASNSNRSCTLHSMRIWGKQLPGRSGHRVPLGTNRATHDLSSFESYVLELQQGIRRDAEALESSLTSKNSLTFREDRWERGSSDANAGYGITAVLEGGRVLEKAAANVSVIRGVLSPERARAMSSRGREEVDASGGQPYSAVAMSLVFHSATPFVPTLRADVRLFEVDGSAWLGGGCDLTPNYLTYVAAQGSAEDMSSRRVQKLDLKPDVAVFHQYWKGICDQYKPALYGELKDWCDRYFYLPCRREHRGTGGIFFDDLAMGTAEFDALAFTRAVGDGILPSWLPIAEKRAHLPFSEAQRNWQELRRGRYIEFNLLYDRGIKFGLAGGRIESIMVSAPPRVQWQYMKSISPEPGSPEADMLSVLREPIGWV